MTENPEFLTEQLITYIGNKRALLPFIGEGVAIVQKQLGKQKLSCLDVFSGSGIVSRYLKQSAAFITANDLEAYSCIINRCYLSNKSDVPAARLIQSYDDLLLKLRTGLAELERARAAGSHPLPGFITKFYSPASLDSIQKSERCFYTPYNANYIDLARQLIDSQVPEDLRHFFIAPLLSQASIHANTAGIFKGFYKNSKTGIGQFGGNGRNALSRILGKISLKLPVFSEFECPFRVFNQNANDLVESPALYAPLGDAFDGIFDLAYFDPPYNQHPYGSNYFMLNLIASYKEPDPQCISRVSGIPMDWNRSAYNKRRQVAQAFLQLVKVVRARYVLISFNSEGFIKKSQMIDLLRQCGDVHVMEAPYNTFRGSRNLKERELYVKEYLFLIRKEFPGKPAI